MSAKEVIIENISTFWERIGRQSIQKVVHWGVINEKLSEWVTEVGLLVIFSIKSMAGSLVLGDAATFSNF